MRYRKKIRNQIRGTGQARRRGREELEGMGEGEGGEGRRKGRLGQTEPVT